MNATPPPAGFYFFLAVFWLVVLGTVLMALWKLAAWWGNRYATVNDYAEEEVAESHAVYVHPAAFNMSSSVELPDRTAVEPAEPVAVRGDTHQPEPAEPAQNEPVREPMTLRQLPKNDLIVLLALQRNDEGKYLYSANEITNFVGGTAAPIKALIAEVRDGPKPPPAPQPVGRIERPANGWPA